MTPRRPRPSLLLLAVLSGVLSCEDETGPPAPPPSNVPSAIAVAVDPRAAGPRIPADFLGLGFELPVMADPRLSSSPMLARMLLALGPGTLRFGGNSVELTRWTPGGRQRTPLFQLTPADVAAVFGFARRIGWRVSVAVDFASREPALADESAYLVASGGDALLGIEIGNEPNLYPLTGLRSKRYSVDSLVAEFDASAAALRERAPTTPIAGPSTWCTGGGAWFAGFLDQTTTTLAFASQHFYPMGASEPSGSSERASVANMLSPELMARTRACVDSAATAARARGLALRVDETNSAFGFGKRGVSDVFASALWGLDHLFTLAELGVAGVNLQTGTGINGGLTCAGVYLPVCELEGEWVARPLYYAMLMFHQAAVGRMVPARLTAAVPANVVAHAVAGDDGGVRVVVINKELAAPADVELSLPSAGGPATALRLTATSPFSRSGVTLGGAAVGVDGGWTPGVVEAIVAVDGVYRLAVPPASAVLLTIGTPPH